MAAKKSQRNKSPRNAKKSAPAKNSRSRKKAETTAEATDSAKLAIVDVKHTSTRYDNDKYNRPKNSKATRTTAKRHAVRVRCNSGDCTVGEIVGYGKAAIDVLARYVRAGNYVVDGFKADAKFALDHEADRELADKLRLPRHADKLIVVHEIPTALVK